MPVSGHSPRDQCLPPIAVQDVVRRTMDRLEGIVSQTAPGQEPPQQQPGRLPPLTAEAVAAQHKALARLTADMQRQLDQLSKAVEGLQRVRGLLACRRAAGLFGRLSLQAAASPRLSGRRRGASPGLMGHREQSFTAAACGCRVTGSVPDMLTLGGSALSGRDRPGVPLQVAIDAAERAAPVLVGGKSRNQPL